jgi:para-nitrobenzyl esterase
VKTIIAASTLGLSVLFSGESQPPRTHVTSGPLSGVWEGEVAAFLGVPYAAAPVGAKRWRPPQSPPIWETTLAADQFSNSCIQTLNPEGGADNPWTREYSTQGDVSEDCLYLNVWTGRQHEGERQPVLVWVHGGAFINGAGSIPIYHGASLAKRGIVVVTINYRVGVLGFLAHPELSAESPHGVSGNYGLLDAVAALEWVRDNIAAFGGDPERVTVAGQSAGARAVQALIHSPRAKGLFARAILQSRPRLDPLRDDIKAAEAAGVEFAASQGVTSIEELRGLSALEVFDGPEWIAGRGPRFVPVFDGWFLPAQPADSLESGTYNDTPVMAGITADEGSVSEARYARQLSRARPEHVRRCSRGTTRALSCQHGCRRRRHDPRDRSRP